jgi:zona occludens toxin (predicted ATPase)
MRKPGLIEKMDIEFKWKKIQLNISIIIMDMEDQEFHCHMARPYKYSKFSSVLFLYPINRITV